ncbi:MAG: bifunctional lysylphosphatidylglycerol flippase/synthetase MprF [Burkholderiales bacterium]
MSEIVAATDEREGRQWFGWLAPVLSLAVFALVIYVIHRELGQLHLRDVLARLTAVPTLTLLLAAAFTALSYWLLGFYDWLALRYVGRTVSYTRTLFTAFIAYAFGHNLSFAAFTGAAIRYRLYSSAGLSAADVATVSAFCSLTTGIGFAVVAGVSLLVEPAQATTALHLHRGWAMFLGLALLVLVASYVIWGLNGLRVIEIRGWALRPPGARVVIPQFALAVVDIGVAAAVLWILLPSDANIAFVTFAGVYAVACFAGIASHVPGGLGVFESVIIVALPHVARDVLLGSLLAYRAIYYLAPLLIAACLFASRELTEQRAKISLVVHTTASFIAPIVPQVSGTLVFLAGFVLLISGATPGIDARLADLKRFMPLPVLELSHLAGSVIGLGLLILARALFRRVHAAFQITRGLLLAGIIASLLKGLDVEEALFLVLVLSVLWVGRRGFYRPSSILQVRFSAAWVVSLTGVIAFATWVGYLAHRDVAYSNDLWWTFALHGDAPRMLRAVLVVSVLGATFIVANLFKPPPPASQQGWGADWERVAAVIATSHHSLANVALAGDKRLLFSDAGDAFIMYQISGRSWVALGDPVGSADAHEELVWRFRELADRQGGWAVFYEVSGDRLPLYLDLGLAPLKLGEEARVRLTDFSLEGSERASLRRAHRRAQRDGAEFQMVSKDGVDELMPTLKEISDAWLVDKATAEKGFSVGAFSPAYLRHFPVGVVRSEGNPVAFANIWVSADKEELSVDLMRFSADAPRSAMDYLFGELMLWGKAQGYRWFNLGMAPLSGLERHPLAPAWHRIGSFVFRHGEHFYNFEGVKNYKEKFHPIWEPKYLMSPGGLALPRILTDVSVLIAGGVKQLIGK